MSELTNGEIKLVLTRDASADPQRLWVRTLHYGIVPEGSDASVGSVQLRLGYTQDLVRYGGHLGYDVDEKHRGNHYAAQACLLLRSVAQAHGMDVLWITCNPDNWPSRRTCERIGATLVEIVELPPDNDQYLRGERRKCRYRWLTY